MKNQYKYRNPYIRKKPARRTAVWRIILVIILAAVLVWILYQNNRGTPAASEQSSGILDFLSKQPPNITIQLDGINYSIAPLKESEPSAASGTANIRTLSMGKNSKAQFTFAEEPDNYKITLYQGDKEALSVKTPLLFAQDLPGEGEFRGVVEATWNSGADYVGTAIYHFIFSVDFPPVIEYSATEIDPGELLVMTVKYVNPDENIAVETDLDFKPNIFKYEDEHIIMLPVSYYNAYDKIYQIKLTIGDETYSYPLKVNNKEFAIQHMTIDPKIAAETRNDQSAAEVVEKVDPLRPVCDETPYWTGKFLMPVEGGRVSEKDFGKTRYVNKAPTSYRHNGLDIGHDKGVPVMASNNGRVLLAEYLIGTGNSVMIEHGFGLKTWYFHMDELSVSVGDMVNKGDIIGKVGSTGFSTGPHLHFSASINNAYINPLTLINEGVPLIERED